MKRIDSYKSQHFNVMTSCDRNLLRYLPVQVVSIRTAMPDDFVDFYLFHRDMQEVELAPLNAVCTALDIRFHPVQVQEPEKYDMIASHGSAYFDNVRIDWPGEAYFSLCAWQYLPETEDRVLYIDAGDILIFDSIAPYYSTPFDGKMLTVTPSQYKLDTVKFPDGGGAFVARPFQESDLETDYMNICHTPTIFNSGCYVINLDRMRREKLNLDDYLAFCQELRDLSGGLNDQILFEGDQGFLSAAFLGDLKFFEREGRIDISFRPHDSSYLPYNFSYRPYNFLIDSIGLISTLDYTPAVAHYSEIKPWNTSFADPVPRFSGKLTERQAVLEEYPGSLSWYHCWQTVAKYTDKLMTGLGF